MGRQKAPTRDFYPRSPCGERPTSHDRDFHPTRFLSTLSLRRATSDSDFSAPATSMISIHALLAESDSKTGSAANWSSDFYPRSPCGERRRFSSRRPFVGRFLSTLSLRRATNIAQHPRHLRGSFLSTLSLRRATRRWESRRWK